MWSSEPRESIAICKANVAALFLNHFKTLSVGPVPRIERGCSRALYLLSYSSRVYNCKTCHIAYFFSRPLEVLSERQKQLISLEWDIWLDCKTVCFFLKIGLVKSPRGPHTHAREKKNDCPFSIHWGPVSNVALLPCKAGSIAARSTAARH